MLGSSEGWRKRERTLVLSRSVINLHVHHKEALSESKEKGENALKTDHRELAKEILTKSKITTQASFEVISARANFISAPALHASVNLKTLTNSAVKDASTEAHVLITVALAVGVAVQTNSEGWEAVNCDKLLVLPYTANLFIPRQG